VLVLRRNNHHRINGFVVQKLVEVLISLGLRRDFLDFLETARVNVRRGDAFHIRRFQSGAQIFLGTVSATIIPNLMRSLAPKTRLDW